MEVLRQKEGLNGIRDEDGQRLGDLMHASG